MSIERVKAYFRKYGIEGRIRELDASSATVELAAAALGCGKDCQDAFFFGGRPWDTGGSGRRREN